MLWPGARHHTYGEVCKLRQDWLQEGQKLLVADNAQDKLEQLRHHCWEGEVVCILIHLPEQQKPTSTDVRQLKL